MKTTLQDVLVAIGTGKFHALSDADRQGFAGATSAALIHYPADTGSGEYVILDYEDGRFICEIGDQDDSETHHMGAKL